MQRTLSAALAGQESQRTVIEGWIHRRRRLAGVTFLIVRDRSGLAQVVVTDPATREQLDRLGEETVVRVEGRVTANLRAPLGVELTEPMITPLSSPAEPTVLELWRPALEASLPIQLDQGAVAWRHPRQRACWQVAAASLRGFRLSLEAQDFTEIQTPKLVAGSTESGANVFEVDYFGRPAYLAQSPQFYKQMMVGVFERVYETGPVFRAEPHDTVRHLAEYVSLDAELGFITDHRDVLAVLRNVIAGMLDELRRSASAAMALAGVRLPEVPEQFPIVHFREALALVGADPEETDLAPEHERRLGVWARERFGSDFLAVEGYPAAKRPFYTQPEPGDARWTNSFDLLFRGLELVTGGQRLHELGDYERALAARGESMAPYASYLQAFRHGMPPHGGFAIGLARWTARLLEVDNIRRTTLFPRDLHRLAP
ncbi:aspartate--tRNA(Asn) ligase [Microlunatus panaciterrae]|uniref:Aspartate--tRNA(Asp/Asn) ligase n=1 Tax=Microlunatus panaciterrae TaxID=400768 RepID=A0ABS2RIK2_9ACTN|nr:aspartate--tRNA(Asn) ligase [Microlunatus panaciterrae]MBM7798825.1 nondiscriminating aspartyl-tRNA synthetase [Microlunatus panaciterrae]